MCSQDVILIMVASTGVMNTVVMGAYIIHQRIHYLTYITQHIVHHNVHIIIASTGVVNMVFGYGNTVGEAIVTHPQV